MGQVQHFSKKIWQAASIFSRSNVLITYRKLRVTKTWFVWDYSPLRSWKSRIPGNSQQHNHTMYGLHMSPILFSQPWPESRAPIDQNTLARTKVKQKKCPLAQPAETKHQMATSGVNRTWVFLPVLKAGDQGSACLGLAKTILSHGKQFWSLHHC